MKKIPLRKCIGCGVQKPKRELLRVVCTKEGDVYLDKTGRANGRGAYICSDVSCFDQAVKKKAFSRALKCSMEDSVLEALRRELDAHE